MLISDNVLSYFTELSCEDDPFHKEFTTFCIGLSSQFWCWWCYYGFLPSVGCWCWEPVLPCFSHQQLPAAANWRRATNPSFCQNFYLLSQKISLEFCWQKPMVDISFGINLYWGVLHYCTLSLSDNWVSRQIITTDSQWSIQRLSRWVTN